MLQSNATLHDTREIDNLLQGGIRRTRTTVTDRNTDRVYHLEKIVRTKNPE